MVARDIMNSEVVAVRPEDPVSKVADLMKQCGHGTFPVVDDENNVIGTISKDRLIRLALPVFAEEIGQLGFLPDSYRFHGFEEEESIGQVAVGEVMSSDPVQVAEDEPVAEVARNILEYDIDSTPVVREGKLVGIVSRSDLVEAIVHPSLGGGQR